MYLVLTVLAKSKILQASLHILLISQHAPTVHLTHKHANSKGHHRVSIQVRLITWSVQSVDLLTK